MSAEIGRHVTVEDVCLMVDDGPWWIAHDFPERKNDEWAIWSWDCDACMYHLIASAVQDPGSDSTAITEGESVDIGSLWDTLRLALDWREEHGYPQLEVPE